MNNSQTGGLDNLLRIPTFKYTTDKKRILLIESIYPYADVLVNTVRDIPWSSYHYNGPVEVRNMATNELYEYTSTTTTKLNYYFTGGTAYEILNNRYQNVDLHKYTDPTGDVDVAVHSPLVAPPDKSVPNRYDYGLYYYKTPENTEVSSFYRHLTEWLFDNVYKSLSSYKNHFDEMFPALVDFDLSTDYDDIPEGHDTVEQGFQSAVVGKMKLVGFSSGAMYKVQVICKVVDPETGLSATDHVLELIIPLPEAGDEFNPMGEAATKHPFTVISFSSSLNTHRRKNSSPRIIFPSKSKTRSRSRSRSNSKSRSRTKSRTSSMDVEARQSSTEFDTTHKIQLYSTYNIQPYTSMIEDNIKAYKFRSSNEYSKLHGILPHKYINHVARILYLYELMYHNPSAKTENIIPRFVSNKKLEVLSFFYYKYVYKKQPTSTSSEYEGELVKIKIKIPIGMFLNAYQKILKSEPRYKFLNQRYPNYFNNKATDHEMETNHSNFLKYLFDPYYAARTYSKVTYKAPSRMSKGGNSKTIKLGGKRRYK